MLALSFVLAVLAAEPEACPAELFRIERSKNANVVLYEAKPGKETALDPDDPVSASWLLLATTGKRESLTFFEKLFAYGFEVRLSRSAQSAVLTLKALRGRTIRVAPHGGCLVAFGSIGGAEVVLKRVFVTTNERGAAPSVTGIELFGVDPVTGEARSEKIPAK
ncbi:MAG: DUF4833 domain-containing protein [Archangium sp.]|nr:DUF4833 domain-containing protein [Archangium sp.]